MRELDAIIPITIPAMVNAPDIRAVIIASDILLPYCSMSRVYLGLQEMYPTLPLKSI